MQGASGKEKMQLVVIASFREAALAYLAAARLETEGMPVFLEKDRSSGFFGPSANILGSVRMLVPAAAAAESVSILQSDYSAALLLDGLGASREGDAINCPHCGSARIAVPHRRRRAGVWALLAGLPSMLCGIRYRCLDCGGKWKDRSIPRHKTFPGQ